MKIKDKIKSFWDVITTFLGFGTKSGSILLVVSGPKTVVIKTGWHPSKVYIGFNPPLGIPVCQGSVDSFDVIYLPHGFALTVNLNSETREVEWIAKR